MPPVLRTPVCPGVLLAVAAPVLLEDEEAALEDAEELDDVDAELVDAAAAPPLELEEDVLLLLLPQAAKIAAMAGIDSPAVMPRVIISRRVIRRKSDV